MIRQSIDSELIKDILQGNKKSFRKLYDKYVKYHKLTCLRYINNDHQADDVLQESYIAIYRSLKNYDHNKSKYITWSNRIVIYTCLKALKKQNFNLSSVEIDQLKSPPFITDEAINNLSLQELTETIRSLPPGYRTVFNMYVIDGYKHEEIAEKLGISVGTSRSQFSKAKSQLRSALKNNFFNNFGYVAG